MLNTGRLLSRKRENGLPGPPELLFFIGGLDALALVGKSAVWERRFYINSPS
jgi:hypothetical protein